MKIINFFLKTNAIVVVIIAVSVTLTIIWFSQKNILGTGESGLPFYNPQLMYENFKTSWANYALGFPTNITIASKPSYWFLGHLQALGIPSFLLQAFFFLIILLISGLSIYFLSQEFFPGLNPYIYLLSTLFYWFNPFSLVNVWNRFLNNFFVFYALLPLAVLIFIRGIKTKKYNYAIYLGLSSALFSYALTSLAFVFIFWFALVYIFLFYLFIVKQADKKFLIKYFLLCLIFWVLSNFWWIGQVFTYISTGSFKAVMATSFTQNGNYSTFSVLSKNLGDLIYLLRLKHATFFQGAEKIPYVVIYLTPVIIFLEFFISSLFLLPIITKKRNANVLLLGSFFILSIFLTKGNNPPFGEIFDWFFQHFSYLQLFRNPFEKFGFLLTVAAAPLFALGVHELGNILKKWQKYIYLLVFFWITIVWGFPFWSNLVFTGPETPINRRDIGYQVKVPQSYQQANNWLSSQGQNFRLLVLPISEEGITYNWQKGYSGVELSNQILPITSVSFQTNIPFYEDISSDLENTFLSKDNFTKVTNLLNAKYIMFRNDIDWRARETRDPQIIFKKLKDMERDGQFKLVKDFGGLVFWENVNWLNKEIYLSNQTVLISPQPKMSDSQFISDKNDVIIGDKANLDKLRKISEVIHPVARLSLESGLPNTITNEQDIFPYIKFSPTSKIYPLLILKEKLDLNLMINISDKMNFLIKILGKRLVEAQSEKTSNNPGGSLIAINEYNHLLGLFDSIIPQYQTLKAEYEKQLMNQEEIYNIFLKHKKVLEDLIEYYSNNQNMVNKLRQTIQMIDSKLIMDNIGPLFGFKESSNFPIRKRIGYKFNIVNEGEYELFWGNTGLDKYYKDINNQPLQIDGLLTPMKSVYNSLKLRSFGKVYLEKGVHEVAINTPKELNLVEARSEIDLIVQHGLNRREYNINDFDPYASYTVSFDYWIKKGSGIQVQVESNNTPINLGQIQPNFSQGLGPDNYNFEEKHFSTSFKLTNTSNSAKLIFIAKPWNDCETIFFTRGKERCKDESFKRPYDRTTEVIVKNISITRNLVDEPFLIKSNLLPSSYLPKMTFKKIDNTEYVVDINDATQPYVVVLSELFDPGWKIFTSSGSEVKAEHLIANTYANGWIIDKVGNYKLKLEFVPQKVLSKGELISGFVVTSSIFLLLGLKIKNK